MTTTRVFSEYLPPQNTSYRSYAPRDVPPLRDNYLFTDPNSKGVITKKSRSGSYNVIEKDFGDHKRIYHVPVEYGDNYDISQLDEPPIIEPVVQKPSPQLVRRRIYHQYEEPVNYEYVEIPSPSPPPPPPVTTRHVYVSPPPAPRPVREEVGEEIIETVPVNRKVRYIYEDDYANAYEYRPVNEEVVEYVVREPAPQTVVRYPQPRTVFL